MCNRCLCGNFSIAGLVRYATDEHMRIRDLYTPKVPVPYDEADEEVVGSNLDIYLRHWDEETD